MKRKWLAIGIILLFLFFTNSLMIPCVKSVTLHKDNIIMRIHGGIGYSYVVWNYKAYPVNGTFNLTDEKGIIGFQDRFIVYPNNQFGTHTFIPFTLPLTMIDRVQAELTVENQTLVRIGVKLFIFFLFQ